MLILITPKDADLECVRLGLCWLLARVMALEGQMKNRLLISATASKASLGL